MYTKRSDEAPMRTGQCLRRSATVTAKIRFRLSGQVLYSLLCSIAFNSGIYVLTS